MSSNLALGRVLRTRGHEVTIVSRDPPPPEFAFLAGFDRIQVRSPDEVRWSDFDVFWALDLSSPTRVGAAIDLPPELHVLVIDHHQTNRGWGTDNLVDSQAPSTTVMLYRLFAALGLPIDADLATGLLTGLAGDTGFFAQRASPEAFAVAADLMTLGARYQEIVFHVNQHTDATALRLVGQILATAEVVAEARMVVFRVPYAVAAGALSAETHELLTSHARVVQGTDFGAILVEERPGDVRVSLRARGADVDVATIAVKLGGGGHTAAAGAQLTCGLDAAVARIRQVALERAAP